MTLIEGFGDEVTLLLAATFFVVLLYLVWISTHVPNRPLLYLQLTGGNQTFNNTDLQHLSGLDVSQSELNEGSYNSSPQGGVVSGAPIVNSNGVGGGNGASSSSNESASTEDELRNENSVETAGASNSSSASSQPTGAPVTHSTINSLRSFVGQVHQSAVSTLRRRNTTSASAAANASEPAPTNSAAETQQASSQPSSSDNQSNPPYTTTQFSLSSLNLELPQTLRDQQPDCYFIKLKFLNDLQCEVEVHPSEKLTDFKTRVFRDVISAGGHVRLIFAGGLLRDESLSLIESGVLANCVIHCHILAQSTSGSGTQNGTGTSNDSSSGRLDNFNSDNIDLSNLMFLLFAIFLSVLWYLRFSYRCLFTPPTTFTLIAITLLFLLAIYASFIL